MKEKIGFMGMGIMGAPMARNIAAAGYPLTVFNRDRKKAEALASVGAAVSQTPGELAEGSDVVIAMLTGAEALNALLWGPGGAVEGFQPNRVFINMSTVSPGYTRELVRKLGPSGVRFIDAPVAGSKQPAEEGTLTVLAGGASEDVEALKPLLLTMGKKVVYCGEAGRGSLMKMTVNLLLAIMMEGFAEAINFGRVGGLSMESIMEVLSSGPLNCGLFQGKAEMLRTNVFPPNFPLKHIAKDLKYVVDTAYENNAPVPSAQTMLHLYSAGVGKQWGDLDFASIIKTLQHLNPPGA